MTSSNTYREYVNNELRFCDFDSVSYHIYNKIKYLELPRFIWVVELASSSEFDSNKISGLIIYDTTASAKEKSAKLFVLGKSFMQYKDFDRIKKTKFKYKDAKQDRVEEKNVLLNRFSKNFD